jgi:hypothetical protein
MLRGRDGNQSTPCGDKEGQNDAGQDEIERHYQGIRLPSKQVGQPHHPNLNSINRRDGLIVGQASRHQLVVNMCSIAYKGERPSARRCPATPSVSRNGSPKRRETRLG